MYKLFSQKAANIIYLFINAFKENYVLLYVFLHYIVF